MTRQERHLQVVDLKNRGLTFKQIAQQLGLGISTVTGAYYDPTGDKDRERKSRRFGFCVDCGARVTNGGMEPNDRCRACYVERMKTNPVEYESRSRARTGRRVWSDEQIFAAIRRSATNGIANATVYDRLYAEDSAAMPSMANVRLRFGMWNTAVEAAGLKTHRGAVARADRTPDERVLAAVRECAAQMGRRPSYSEYDAWARGTGAPCASLVRLRFGGSWVEATRCALEQVPAMTEDKTRAVVWPHQNPALPATKRLWWLAEEMSNTADAIGPVPELAERSLRAHAEVLRELISLLRDAP